MEADPAGGGDPAQHVPHRVQALKFLPGKTNWYWNEERLMCYIILFSIVIGYSLFMINDAAHAAENYSALIPLLISAVFLSTVTNQVLAAFINPGIIEPAADSPESGVPSATEELWPSDKEFPVNEHEMLVRVRTTDSSGRGSILNLKFCKTCKIIRPPRSSHCKYCDVCVYRSDHHCPYLGNCIGLKNYKNFYYFLVSVVFLTGIGLTFSLLHILDLRQQLGSGWNAAETSPISVLVMVAAIAGGSFPLGLLCFHTYILLAGLTSREALKKHTSNENSERSRNPIRNCLVTLCRTRKPVRNFQVII